MDMLKLPNQGSLALAICIVRSKPEDISIQEYIRLLRRHVAKGRRENAISTAYHHLDRSSFWRSEYERKRDALIASETQVTKLTRELEIAKARLEAAESFTATKKRNNIETDTSPDPMSPKRARRASSPVSEPTLSMLSAHESEVPVSETADDLMRSLSTIRQMFQDHTTPGPLELHPHLIHVASTLPQVLSERLAQSFLQAPSGRADLHPLHATCAVVRRAVALMIASANKTGHSQDAEESKGSFIYNFVRMYAGLLHCLYKASDSAIATKTMLKSVASNRLKPAKTEPTSKPRLSNMKDHPVLNAVTSLLCGIIELLDPELKLHNALFEGIAYSIIDKTGSALFSLIFGHARGSTIQEEIASCLSGDRNAHSSVTNLDASASNENGRDKLLAPFLVHLLKRVMAASPSHLGSNQTPRTGAAKKVNLKVSTKGILAVSAKERLQRTLVNCTFGTEGEDEGNPFKDCLRMPNAQPSLLPIPRVKEPDVEEWFQEEVWRLLGWEILSKEDSWC